MTTNKITESEIEQFAIELLEHQGYQYIYAPDIAPDSDTPERNRFEDVLLLDRLRTTLGRINPDIPPDAREDAIKQIQRLNSPELIANNEAFNRMLTEGIKVSYQKDGANRGDLVWLVDFNNPQNNEFLVNGLEAKAGSLSAGSSRFMAWKSSDGKVEASLLIGQLETLINGMLNKTTLLDLIRHFIVFEKSKKEDKDTGVITIQTVKKLATYHQYYAVNRAVESTLRASGYAASKDWQDTVSIVEDPESYDLPGVKKQPFGDRKGGVVWQDHLKELLNVASGGVVFTTIQKFQPEEGNVYPRLSDRRNIIVIADEAHRTQYGFKAKIIDIKDEQKNVIGQKIVYGFAKYTRDALPNATYLGFTGTPIEKTDVNTPAVFGNYVDIYDISQAVEDGATVKIYYESRLAKIALSKEGKKLVSELDEELEKADLAETQKAKAKLAQ